VEFAPLAMDIGYKYIAALIWREIQIMLGTSGAFTFPVNAFWPKQGERQD
jgi:hypothetical protein